MTSARDWAKKACLKILEGLDPTHAKRGILGGLQAARGRSSLGCLGGCFVQQLQAPSYVSILQHSAGL